LPISGNSPPNGAARPEMIRARPTGPVHAGLALTVLILIPAVAASMDLARIRDVRNASHPDAAESIDPATFRALRDFAGDDLVGRDGILARIGFDLLLLHHEQRLHRRTAGAAPFRSSLVGILHGEQSVLIDLVAQEHDIPALHRAANRLGLEDGHARGRILSGWFPIAALTELARTPGLAYARPVHVVSHAGAVTSQGDIAHGAATVRNIDGFDGSGVTVGVLSDSYDCLGGAANDVATGDLPADIRVLEDISECAGAVDEGRAMMQIVHDLAPAAAQVFHSAFNGTAAFAAGIEALADTGGAEVIVDDVGILNEPWFQDGIVARAAAGVVADGIAYFSSAGNLARQSYESDFRPSGVAGAFGERHDFDENAGIDTLQTLTIPAGATVRFYLQWDQPFFSTSGPPGASSEMALVIYAGGAALFASSDANVGADAFDFLGITNGGTADGSIAIAVERIAGPPPARIKYVYIGPLQVDEYAADTRAATVLGHANAAGVRAVGAANYRQTPAFGRSPPRLESFSSRAGVTIRLDINGAPIDEPRRKPEIVAADGVDTTFFGSTDPDASGFPNFFGTSAAAPHAAAIAALMKAADAKLAPGAVYGLLQDTAIDMEAAGLDDSSGYGLIQAAPAIVLAARAQGGTVIGFSSAPDGTPVDGSAAADLYAAAGVTLVDSDPATPGFTSVAGPPEPSNAGTGINGPYLQVAGVAGIATFLDLELIAPVQQVMFRYATPAGGIRVTARNTAGTVIAENNVTASLPFVVPGEPDWLTAGTGVQSREGIARVRIEPLAASDPLIVDNVLLRPELAPPDEDIPLPAGAWLVLGLLIAFQGVRAARRTNRLEITTTAAASDNAIA